MTAEREIENLLYLYAELMDAGDIEGIADLFARGRICAPTGDAPREGRDAVLQMYQEFTRLYADGTPRTQHMTSNCRIVVDEQAKTAESHARFCVLQATEELPLQPIMAGRYEDKFAHDGNVWYFRERTMIPVLSGELTAHLKVQPQAS